MPHEMCVLENSLPGLDPREVCVKHTAPPKENLNQTKKTSKAPESSEIWVSYDPVRGASGPFRGSWSFYAKGEAGLVPTDPVT